MPRRRKHAVRSGAGAVEFLGGTANDKIDLNNNSGKNRLVLSDRLKAIIENLSKQKSIQSCSTIQMPIVFGVCPECHRAVRYRGLRGSCEFCRPIS